MSDARTTIPIGRIDIHSHALPAIDDGCESIEETIEALTAVQGAGFVGSICTPHMASEVYPTITPQHVGVWVDQLRQQLHQRGLNYHLWAGGELRLFEGSIDWMKQNGVPTLADSRCVLLDFWVTRWARWINKTFTWLMSEGYQPIWAHPERMNFDDRKFEKYVRDMAREGVLLQGNFQCMTGEAGYHADQRIRRWLDEGLYSFLAMDMHRPLGLEGRLDGITMVETEYGRTALDTLTRDNPRRLIFGL
ncbi:MAG: hypothetical protein IT445_07900 [Phycisphaeraceae bacterium]|nr:hypothetical protein [Phycisphaeraceae bacterium]